MAKQERREDGWFGRAAMSQILNVRPRRFDLGYRDLAPAAGVRTNGRRKEYFARDIIDAHIERELERRVKRELREQSIPTAALERKREREVELLDMRIARERGEQIPVADVRRVFGIVAGRLRVAGELLQRAYGPEAQTIIDEALDLAAADMTAAFSEPEEAPRAL